MAKWKKTVAINPVVRDSSLSLAEKGKRISDLLRGHVEFTYGIDLADEILEAAESGDVEEFDKVLEMIYDRADWEYIWLGTASYADSTPAAG